MYIFLNKILATFIQYQFKYLITFYNYKIVVFEWAFSNLFRSSGHQVQLHRVMATRIFVCIVPSDVFLGGVSKT